jgi:hypothetical protein
MIDRLINHAEVIRLKDSQEECNLGRIRTWR